MSSCPSDPDPLLDTVAWPLSRLFHDATNLGSRTSELFIEGIEEWEAAQDAPMNAPGKQHRIGQAVPLPNPPRLKKGLPVRTLLRKRRTRRGEFDRRPISRKQLGALLALACGRTGEVHVGGEGVQELRAWPSAGALYPIETYVFALKAESLSPSIFHYNFRKHHLIQLGPIPPEEELHSAVLAGQMWRNASAMIVLTGVFARTQAKYGERGYRFVLMEAGHVMQNILLMAEDLRLAAIPLGAFHEAELARWIGMDVSRESPLYAVLLGCRPNCKYPSLFL